MVEDNDEAICAAVMQDHGASEKRAFVGEIFASLQQIRTALDKFDEWTQSTSVGVPFFLKPGSGELLPQPKGIILIIGPYNYPVSLVLAPLAAALAAGNTVLLKPSEHCPTTDALLCKLIKQYFDPSVVGCVRGDHNIVSELLSLRWDHIMFTGSTHVGKIVATAAAKFLTPCTLELGGKSPVYVDASANIPLAAKRIALAKLTNNGQICVCPDYILAHKSVAGPLAAAIVAQLREWLGADEKKWLQSDVLQPVIDDRAFLRVYNQIQQSDGKVLCGGTELAVQNRKYIPPTVVWAPSTSSPLMTDEIFGPALPIMPVESKEEFVKFVNAREKPLALYIFSSDEAVSRYILDHTFSGNACINDCVDFIANLEAPFGGVGSSGYGRYNGKWGFDEFSHLKNVCWRSTWLDSAARYPPTGPNEVKQLRVLAKTILPNVGLAKRVLTVVALGGALMLHSRL
jgi:acyl-CoA reductase-like NAD-dependent aldehyde dehydrogenase